MKIDANSDGSVDWNEFMNYMLLENETLASMKAEVSPFPNPSFQHFRYVKSDKGDPSPNQQLLCHSDMITNILILTPEPEKSHFGGQET